MKMLIITTLVATSLAGAANAGVSNFQYLEAARCRGLASSENLGTLDTAAIDAFLRREGASRTLAVKASAQKKMSEAVKAAAAADGAKKSKLLSEREGVCAAYINGG
ncbi:MAG: hypothetical protein LCH78_15015 [Proteobacteria bacterium]|nr:hypothetical protein [Pseudomonadota bacterium]